VLVHCRSLDGDQRAPYASHVLVPLLLAGTGFGLSIVPLTMGGTTGVPASQAGLASGLIQTSRQIGGAIGLAIMGTAAAAALRILHQSLSQAVTAAAAVRAPVADLFLIIDESKTGSLLR